MKQILLPLSLALVLSACGGSGIPEYSKVTNGEPDPVHGEQVSMTYGALSGVGDTKANGVAYARLYKDGVSIVTVNLNVQLAPEDSSYVARLKDSGQESYEIGTLTSLVGDVRHTVSAEFNEDLSDADMVEVLLGDQIVATGTLKQVKE